MRKFYQITQSADEAHLYIFGELSEYPWEDLGEQSAKTFRDELAEITAPVIHVHIDSYGGSVSEGWAIYTELKNHPARIVTHGDGFVCSAALYPFMAGDERIASNLSVYYLHQVLMSVSGNADELRKAADEADKINAIGINAFTAVGIPAEKILALEKEETWLSPAEALAIGIATKISTEAKAEGGTQSARADVMRRLAKSEQKQETKQMSMMDMLAKI